MNEILSTEVMIAMSIFIVFMLLMITMVLVQDYENQKWIKAKRHKALMNKLWNMEEAK